MSISLRLDSSKFKEWIENTNKTIDEILEKELEDLANLAYDIFQFNCPIRTGALFESLEILTREKGLDVSMLYYGVYQKNFIDLSISQIIDAIGGSV